MSSFAQLRAKRSRLFSQLAWVKARFAKLDRVADKPSLKPRRFRLKMKLQSELRGRAAERLHRTMPC